MSEGDNPRYRDTLPTQRVGLVMYILTSNPGQAFTTAELARRIGLTHGAVWAMMGKLSATHGIPLTTVDEGWVILPQIDY